MSITYSYYFAERVEKTPGHKKPAEAGLLVASVSLTVYSPYFVDNDSNGD